MESGRERSVAIDVALPLAAAAPLAGVDVVSAFAPPPPAGAFAVVTHGAVVLCVCI